MPARLPGELRHRVIILWVSGLTVEEIEREIDEAASGGSIRNIVAEAKNGLYPEFKDYRSYLDEMRRLAQQLRARTLTLQQASTGLAVHEGLVQLCVDPAQLRDQIELFQKIAPSDFPIDQFNKTALRMSKREAQTGMPFEQLDMKDVEMRSRIARDENRQKELTNSVSSLTAAEENARQSLEQRLSHNKITEEGLQTFLQERDMLQKAGLGSNNLKPVADLIAKCGTEKILTAAKEMSIQVSETGLDPQALVSEYKLIADLREKAVAELNEARAGIRKFQAETQQLQQSRTDQLALNHLTDSQLESFLTTKRQLASWGIDIGKIEPLKKVLSEVERYRFQPNSIVAYLQAIVGLQEQKGQLETQVTNTKGELNSSKKDLQAVKDKIVAKGAELAKLKTSEEQAVSTLSQTQLQIIRARDRVEVVEAFLYLLHDLIIPSEHIETVIESLQQILKARVTVQGFPIDYEPLRRQFKLLVEEALRDKLISREKLDTEIRKLNGQYAIVGSQKRELDREKSRVDHMSTARLLKAAASQNRQGVVFFGVCDNCRATAAVRRGAASTFLNSYHCPCCWGTLDPRPISGS